MYENIKSAFRSLSSGLHWAPPLSGAYCTVPIKIPICYSGEYRSVIFKPLLLFPCVYFFYGNEEVVEYS